jgi:hypothetical protein
VLALAAAQVCMGQSRAYIRTVPNDLADIYARISASAFVVKGKVEDTKYVGLRAIKTWVKEVDGKTVTGATINTGEFGLVATVAIEEVLVRQSDLAAASSQPPATMSLVKMLVPENEAPWDCEFGPSVLCGKETLDRGSEYLLFLREDPRSATLSSIYRVEPGETYYRAVLGSRGAVELPDAPETPSAPLLVAVTALCNALQPPDVPSKLARLRALSATADPRWRGEVDQAIRALQAAQSTPRQ